MALEDILKNEEDLDEPACMDKILMYLEELKEEDEEFMEILLMKLAKEEITWEQPWYQQTNSISRPLKITKDCEEMYKTDTICKEENEIILKNWQKLIKIYDIPDKLVCLARWKNKAKCKLPKSPEERVRRFVISYLAQGLERTTFQIYRHVQTHFGGYVKGTYSKEEEKIVEVCFKNHPNHAVSLLSMVLGREPRRIYKRVEELYNGKPEKKKIIWNLPLATKFLRLLMEYTELPVGELKNRKFDKDVWLKLERAFDQHYIHLQSFWYCRLHVQLFVKKVVKINKLRKKILKVIHQSSSYKIWSDIRWKDVVQHFPDGFTHLFLYKLCYRLVSQKQKYQVEPLKDLLDFALGKIKKSRKRRLKTLQLNTNKELEPVVYRKSDNKQSES